MHLFYITVEFSNVIGQKVRTDMNVLVLIHPRFNRVFYREYSTNNIVKKRIIIDMVISTAYSR